MVLRYWGERGLTAESFSPLVDRSAAGIRTDVLLNELRSRGWTTLVPDGTDAAIAAELERGRPVIALIEDRPSVFHYVVIVGLTGETVIFHDPARAPLRVIGRPEFARRWQAARRWIAVVVPGNQAPADVPPVSAGASRARSACDDLIAAGVQQAREGDLAAAEQTLTEAVTCGAAAALRELAGVRALQKRWADVEALSTVATVMEPANPYGWRLLGTSRFVQDDPAGALAAWNQVGEPKLDLVRVNGLERTRQRNVERLIGAGAGSVLTPALLQRSDRRLRELPAADSAGVGFVPAAGGVGELRATIVERPLLPRDPWSYAMIGVAAAARREIDLATGTLTGEGERFQVDWRFWPGRPRIGVAVDAPAPWGGIWKASAFSERERFTTPELAPVERTGGFVQWSNWVTALTRVSLDVGVEDWDSIGKLGRSRVGLRFLSPRARLDLQGGAELWGGSAAFSRADVTLAALSSTARQGRVYVARAGAAVGSAGLPPLLWFSGDTGHARQTLLRAHPLVDDGRLRSEQLGRRLLNASVEVQQWWSVGLVNVGGAMFVDTARTGDRLESSARGDVDAGIGLRIALPGTPATVRVDVATGLLHGGARWSFVYEP